MKRYVRYGLVTLLGLAVLLAVKTVWRSRHSTSTNQIASARTIRIGTNRALGTVTPYVTRDAGFFQHSGLQVDIVDFNDVTTLMEAFASGQIDVAFVGIAPSAIWQEKGVALKIVASANGGGHVLLTRADTGINDLTGLKGKKVATPKPGTTTDNLAKLDPDKDMQIVPSVAAADMPTVLFVSREVDATISWEPFASQAEARFKNARVLYDASEEWRKSNPQSKQLYPVNVVIARQAFIDSRPSDLRRLLAAHVETIEFINGHADGANDFIARETGLDKSVVAAARRRIDYTAQVDVDASRRTLEWSRQLGYLKGVPSASKLFDLRFLPHEE
jgi:NitT/TauT family transport system substrate-binding protein